MKIKHLDITHFGKFHDRQIELAPGINIIYGQNETGKSTVHSFIGCMLFGAEKLRGRGAGKDTYSRFQPWGGSGAYAGSMTFTYGDSTYRIIRDFQKDNMGSVVIDENTAEIVAEGPAGIAGIIPGFTREKYRNTISAGQVSVQTDDSFASGMRSYLANLSMSASDAVDIDNALQYLKKERSKVNARISSAKTGEEEKQIQSLRNEIAAEKELRDKMAALDQAREQMEKKAAGLQSQYDQAVREDQKSRAAAIRLIQENNDIATQYREKKAALTRAASERIHADPGTLQAEMSEYRQRQQRITDLKYRLAGAQAEMDGSAFRALAFSLPVAALALFIWLLGKNVGIQESARQILALIVLCAAALIFIISIFSALKKRHRVQKLEAEMVPLERSQQALLHKYGVSTYRELEEGAANMVSDSRQEQILRRELAQLRDRYNSLQEPLRPYLEKYGESLSLESDAGEEQLKEIERLREEINDNLKQCSKIEWQLEQIGEQSRQLEILEDRLLEKKQTKNEDLDDLLALDLGIRTIQDITTHIHGTFGADLNEEVSRLFGLISDGSHARIMLDNEFRILVDDGGRPVPVSQVSTGTEDQIYFAVRLAVSRIYFEESMPLILDDSFAFYDDQRLERTLRWLGERSGFPQILLFTCHHREAEILSRAGIPFTFHQLETAT